MEADEELRLSIRSGLSGKGLLLTNGIGIVDADYYNNEENEGNIAFRFINLSDVPVEIKAGDRIGQGVFAKYLTTYDDNASGVRKGGFGSTGR
jgi:dUTP pyrophosphatase